MKLLPLLLLIGCGYPQFPAAPRDIHNEELWVEKVEVGCASSFSDDEPWAHNASGTAVLLDERHALTAAHVVRCAGLPDVHVRGLRMVVTRDEAMFGDGRDFAVLEIASAEIFHLDVVQPVVAPDYIGVVNIVTRRGARTGFLSGLIAEPVIAYNPFDIRPGDSGSPVYSVGGDLVGIVVSRFDNGDIGIERFDGDFK